MCTPLLLRTQSPQLALGLPLRLSNLERALLGIFSFFFLPFLALCVFSEAPRELSAPSNYRRKRYLQVIHDVERRTFLLLFLDFFSFFNVKYKNRGLPLGLPAALNFLSFFLYAFPYPSRTLLVSRSLRGDA